MEKSLTPPTGLAFVPQGQRFMKLVEDARTNIRETTIEVVAERVQRGEQFHLFDVREESEWRKGRMPGAIHLSKGLIERDIESTLPDTKAEIVVYCSIGFRSVLAAEALQKMGYRKVLSMQGGIKAWRAAGLPEVFDP